MHFGWIDLGSVSWKCVVASNLVFWPLSALGLCVDYLAAKGGKRFSFISKCKLQPNRHLSKKEVTDMVLLTAINMLFIAPCICCPAFERVWTFIQGDERLSEADEWDWRREVWTKIPIHIMVTEVGFYSVHFLLHYSPLLFRTIHKVHHRFLAPTAMACVYAHPIEFAVGNIFPIFLGCMLTNAHPRTCYLIWFPMSMAGTCKGHCGYRIMGFTDPHDFITCLFTRISEA